MCHSALITKSDLARLEVLRWKEFAVFFSHGRAAIVRNGCTILGIYPFPLESI